MHLNSISKRRWSSEANLVNRLVSQLPTITNFDADFRICREFSMGSNIADLVAATFPSVAKNQTFEPTTTLESVVLSHLTRLHSARIDDLEKICGLPEQALRCGALDALCKVGILNIESTGNVNLVCKWIRAVKVIAFEAKLTNWRYAIQQAKSYQRYADLSYVVLPSSSCNLAVKHSKEFENLGIGLLRCSWRELETLIPPRTSDSHDWRRIAAISRLM